MRKVSGGLAFFHSSIDLPCDTKDKALKSVCQNAVVVSVLLLADEHHHRLSSIILAVCAPVDEWHSHQSKVCRSAGECEEWVAEQASGGYGDHLQSILAGLASTETLQSAGFIVDSASASACSDGELISENDYATTYGSMLVALLAQRIRRCLWLTQGWPWSMSAILKGHGQERLLDRFIDDVRNFRELKNCSNKTKAAKDIEARHVFNKASNQQLIMAMRDRQQPGFLKDFVGVIKQHSRVAIGTQIVEDSFGTAKNARVVRTSSRYRKPERAMSSVLRHHVLDKRHRWLPIEADAPMYAKTARLGKDSFQPKVDRRSIEWAEVVSTSGATDWYSPKSENYSATTADLAMIKRALELGDANLMGNAWMGEIAGVSHNILLGVPSSEGVRWHHLLHHCDKSAVLAWPGVLSTIPGTGYNIFSHCTEAKGAAVIPVLNLEGLSACTFDWKAWAWVRRQPGVSARTLPVRMYAWITTGPSDALQTVARQCFWSLGRTSIEKFAGLRGAVIPEGSTLCEALIIAIQAILPGVSDDEVLQILQLRLCENDASSSLTEALLEVDDAAELLNRDDSQRLAQEAKSARSSRDAGAEFSKQYSAFHERVRPAAKPRARPSGKKQPRLPASISHSEAKKHIPPGTSIWRGLTRGEWCGQCPPRKRIQCSWFLKGERGAMEDIIRRLWLQHLELRGRPLADCPYPGLLDGGVLEA